jgi:hypothetical protein
LFIYGEFCMVEIAVHPASEIFPLDEGKIPDLAADIKTNGQLVTIKTLHGAILDGRRRHRACIAAGVEPKFEAVEPLDPVAYVLSLNLHHRHLDTSQMAMVAARARKLYDEEAKRRQKEAAARGNQNRHDVSPVPAMLPEPATTGDARDQAGSAVGVSGRSVDKATKVLKQGIPELQKAVDDGKVSVNKAAAIAAKPPEVQREELNKKPPQKGGRGSKVKDRDEISDEDRERAKGLICANKAIDCLKQIPKNDPFRKRGFQIVAQWIKHNQ